MSHEPRDDYLWDPKAPVDPEIERLEQLLRPLGHAAEPAVPPAPAPRANPVWLALGGCAAAAAVVLVALALPRGELGPTTPTAGARPELVVLQSQQRLEERAWVETGAEEKELRLGQVGQVTLGADSRLEVRRLSAEETRLYLERGRLEALVSADAQPRFFQVDTPATRCVDLGCRYSLVVDGEGAAHVEVQTGRVAFENEGRVVLVPRGAGCRATKGAGAGTPRFLDAPAPMVTALDGFDAAALAPADERRARAAEVLRLADGPRDALPLWHLLADPDAEIAAAAHQRLAELYQPPPGAKATLGQVPDARAREAWRETFEPTWW